MIDYTAWLNGLYVKSAIAVFIDKKNKYPSERLGKTERRCCGRFFYGSGCGFDDWVREANKAWSSKER